MNIRLATRQKLPVEKGHLPKPRRVRLPRFGLRTVDLYTIRLFLFAYLVCGVSFIGLFVLIEAFAKLNRFLKQDSALLVSLVRYHVAMIPTVYVNFMGPLLTLAAAMFALTTLNRQNELTPLKAAGVSVYRILMPIFVLAALLSVFTFVLQEKVIPQFKDPIRAALALARASPLKPLPYQDKEKGFLIRVSEYATTTKIAREVSISEKYPDFKPKRRIDAYQMEWIPEEGSQDDDNGYWVLHDGSIQKWDENGNLVVNPDASDFQRLKTLFKRKRLESTLRPIDLETRDRESSEISYLSSKELKAQYQRDPDNHRLAVKLHHHFAFPFSHIILLLLGIPFVLHFENRSVFISMIICFAICGLYFLVDSISLNIAKGEFFSPILAAWLPVMLFGSLGITLFDHIPS